MELRRCYTVKCSVQLVSQCFGDIVAGQVANADVFPAVVTSASASYSKEEFEC